MVSSYSKQTLANQRYRTKAKDNGLTEVRLMIPAVAVGWFRALASEYRGAHKALARDREPGEQPSLADIHALVHPDSSMNGAEEGSD